MALITLQALVKTWRLEEWLVPDSRPSAASSYRLVCHAGHLTITFLLERRELELLALAIENVLDCRQAPAENAPPAPPESLAAHAAEDVQVEQDSSYALHLTLTCRWIHASPPPRGRATGPGYWELGVDDGRGAHVFIVLPAPDVAGLLAETHATLAGQRLATRPEGLEAMAYLTEVEQALHSGEQATAGIRRLALVPRGIARGERWMA